VNSKDFAKQKRTIWARYEKEQNITVPENVRKLIENDIGDWHYKQTDLEALEISIPSYMEIAILYANFRCDSTHYHSITKPEDGNQKRIYRKPLEKRLYLAEFVTERVLTFHNLINRSFTPHKRIRWKRLTGLWNKKHPYDTMTPDRLRTEYYRIIRDNALQHEFFGRRDKEFAQFATEEFRKEATIFAAAMYEASRAHGVDFNFTQGEPIEIRWLTKQLGEPPADEWKLNYMSMLLHNAIELTKAKLTKAKEGKT